MIAVRPGPIVTLGMLLVGVLFLLVGQVSAHCDSTQGPLIPEARAALEAGEVAPVLKWVGKEHEAEIEAVFAQAIAVRGQGGEARDLADQYFLETLVRLHRAGEGAPYTGIKDEPVPPIIAAADRALLQGSVEGMMQDLTAHMQLAVTEKFNRAMEAKMHKDESVSAGRAYVEAYVTYVHYVEALSATIVSSSAHHAEESGQALHSHD